MDAYVRPIAYRRVLGFVASLWMRRSGYFFLGLTLTLAATGFDLLLPWASARLIEGVADSADQALVWQSWVVLLVAFAGFAISRNLAHRLWIPLAARNMQTVLLQGFDHVLSAPADWHATQATGETVRRIRRAMDGYDAVTDATTIHLGPALVVLLGLIVMIGWREPIAGVLALLVALAFIASNLLVGMHWIRPASLQANATDSHLSGIVADVLAASVTIKGFTAERRESNHMEEIARLWGRSSATAWRRFVDLGLVQNLLLLLLLTGLSGVALYTWARGETGPGDVAFAVTSFLLMAGYLRGFGENLRVAQKGLEDAADALLLTALPREEAREPVLVDLPWRGEVVFDGVSFAYPQGRVSVLNRLDLQIKPGETVAIAGASGSGKSTIARLLQRFYEPSAGRILLDGHDIAQLPLATLRQQVSVVTQEPTLLNRSIWENIAYSRPTASKAEVIAAAKAACAHDFILQLPHGYETQVGAYGARLSGGQRQRLALARALLVDAPVLIMDEATSALDPQTEAEVLASIAALRPQQTRIVIAHRPAAILAADRVVWMNKGRVSENSTSVLF